MERMKKAEKKPETLTEFVARINKPGGKLNGNKRVSTQKKRHAKS